MRQVGDVPFRCVRPGVLVAAMSGALWSSYASPSVLYAQQTVQAPAARSSSRASASSHAVTEGDWVRPAHDYASTRYSALRQIDTANVNMLQLAWTFSTGVLRGHEAAPIVANNTMYIITPFPNYVFALDLTKPGAPLKWEYKPDPARASQGVACCDVVNRGVVFDDGRIFFNTLDGHTIALDANTGKEIWNTRVADINRGESMTMAPLVVKGKVLVGNSGGEFGVRGWLKALDASDGHVAWTAYSTGPDSDVLIGKEFKPFYAADRAKDLGVSTWPAGAWKIGGGAPWGWISYDPELDLIYYGTSNPGPWNPDQRPGDNKWTSTIFARHPEDGQAVWAYQVNPHDLHDYDGVNENILADITVNGVARKVLMHPGRNGRLTIIDRATGEVLSANPYVHVTTTTGVDLKTGRLIYDPQYTPQVGKVVRGACPASPGGKDWQPSAYSPQTKLMYIPTNNLCQDVESATTSYIEGVPYVGMNVKMYAGPGGNRGEFIAWDPVEGKKVWGIKETFPAWSGALVTAGNVVFYGTMDGWFKAVNATSGQLLWQFKTGSGIVGQPVTYTGPDGKQYVAILSGVGGWSGAIVAGNLDPRDGTAALGFVNAMADLPTATSQGGMLYVFRLP